MDDRPSFRSSIVTALIGVPAAIPDQLLRSYPELRVARLRRGGLPPLFAGWCLGRRSVAAITLWRTIFLAPHSKADAELLLHELRHVQQFLGSRAFPLRYICETLVRGYHRNRYERDARAWAAARVRVPRFDSLPKDA